ncbi:hypothetical protein, partial [Microcoleus anatoxicus]
AHWVMQRFCTILPVYLAHFSRSHDHITRLCNLSALIQQALDKACLLTLNGSTHSNPSDSNTRTTSLKPEILRYTKLNTTAIITGSVSSRTRSFLSPGVKLNGLKLSGVNQYQS